jgi:hypothetical protein
MSNENKNFVKWYNEFKEYFIFILDVKPSEQRSFCCDNSQRIADLYNENKTPKEAVNVFWCELTIG